MEQPRYMNETQFQRACAEFVQRHVLTSANELMQHLLGAAFGADLYMDVCSGPDFQSTAWEAGWRITHHFNGWALIDPEGQEIDGRYETESEAWRTACEKAQLDLHMVEVLEFWIVDSNLEFWLKNKDEIVQKVHGLTIWGRTTSGQAISVDHVIREIVKEKEGIVVTS